MIALEFRAYVAGHRVAFATTTTTATATATATEWVAHLGDAKHHGSLETELRPTGSAPQAPSMLISMDQFSTGEDRATFRPA